MPSITAIIPVFDGASTVGAAIESALAQDVPEFEVVVVDDASEDATPRVLARYASRVSVIRLGRRSGVTAARNAAVAATRGDYIALLDADDRWLAGKLARTVGALEADRRAVLAYSDYAMEDADGRRIAESVYPPELAHAPTLDEMLARLWPVNHSTVVMRRSAWIPCDEFIARAEGNLRAGLQEDYMLLRAREQGEFLFVSEPLAVLRLAPAAQRAAKWDPRVFLDLVHERYGRRARGLLADVAEHFASQLAQRVAIELDAGNLMAALAAMARILSLRPSYLLRGRHLARLFSRRTASQVVRATLGRRSNALRQRSGSDRQ
jgi:glycosyltransferase involved in cell wall biosynthesis